MSTHLNTKGLEAACAKFDNLTSWEVEGVVTAYLSTSPAHADDLGPVAWHWWSRNSYSTWPTWALGAERPDTAPAEAIALYPASALTELRARVEAAEKIIREAECAVYGKHERGFAMKPLIDPPSLADAITALADAMREERDAAVRRATDRRYMMEAYHSMLGPTALKVAAMWEEKRVQRVHHSWGPSALSLTGEERAQCILDMEDAAAGATPMDSIDSRAASLKAKQGEARNG